MEIRLRIVIKVPTKVLSAKVAIAHVIYKVVEQTIWENDFYSKENKIYLLYDGDSIASSLHHKVRRI